MIKKINNRKHFKARGFHTSLVLEIPFSIFSRVSQSYQHTWFPSWPGLGPECRPAAPRPLGRACTRASPGTCTRSSCCPLWPSFLCGLRCSRWAWRQKQSTGSCRILHPWSAVIKTRIGRRRAKGTLPEFFLNLHLSLQRLYFPSWSLPQLPYMSPALFTSLKHTSGDGRASVVWKKKKKITIAIQNTHKHTLIPLWSATTW